MLNSSTRTKRSKKNTSIMYACFRDIFLLRSSSLVLSCTRQERFSIIFFCKSSYNICLCSSVKIDPFSETAKNIAGKLKIAVFFDDFILF